MKINVKRALLALCLVAVVMVGSIAGTIAWLTATSGTVTNTFTTGDINITLAESTGTDYKAIPGAQIDKDPTVTVVANSEACYVYALVENNLLVDNNSVATFTVGDDWVVVKTEGTKTLYQYKEVVASSTADQKLSPVFTKVTIADTVTKDNIGQLNEKTVIVNAYAHQSANTTEAVADAAAIAWAFPAASN